MKKLIAIDTAYNSELRLSFRRGEVLELEDHVADCLLQSDCVKPWSKELEDKYKKVEKDLEELTTTKKEKKEKKAGAKEA